MMCKKEKEKVILVPIHSFNRAEIPATWISVPEMHSIAFATISTSVSASIEWNDVIRSGKIRQSIF